MFFSIDFETMEPWLELGEEALRQYIDARSVFEACEVAREKAALVRGGMIWRTVKEREYLIRTRSDGSQNSLGARSEDTEQVYRKFVERKESAEARVKSLKEELDKQQRLNRALFVGRAPDILVGILNMLDRLSISEHFIVVGTHALYAYESAAGVRLQEAALATRDVDLLWDTRKRLQFVSRMKAMDTSMLGALRKVDKTFELDELQPFTAVNSKGFEVDIIRREHGDDDPHPLRLTDDEGDFWAVQARRANVLLSAKPFSTPIVATSGKMARMRTIDPRTFVEFKRWMADLPDRDPVKVSRDRMQASIVERLTADRLSHVR
ncbi:nucleotidyltransferase domain-containing protein [Cupriavidus plantarum]|nr:nucleotidyltransferase domain-containing protein [Cupriavidus plantarum]